MTSEAMRLKAHLRKVGEVKAASHREMLAAHLALPVGKRMEQVAKLSDEILRLRRGRGAPSTPARSSTKRPRCGFGSTSDCTAASMDDAVARLLRAAAELERRSGVRTCVIADRPQDRADVAAIVEARGGDLDRELIRREAALLELELPPSLR